jgi:Bpu10I restriction endonuclease
VETSLAYVAAECKTNLDKTMFQEASATARDIKAAVTGAKYFVICEWLDMTPLSTAATDIDEVLILRGKRLGSHIRRHFDTAAKRQAKRVEYTEYLSQYPARAEVFRRFVRHIQQIFTNELPVERDVLERGYF